MPEEFIQSPSSAAVLFMLDEQRGGFTPFERALAGLSGEEAVKRPAGSPHSPAEVLAHIVFWQDRFFRASHGETLERVESAALGWPSVTAAEWDGLVERCLANLERYRSIARDQAELDRPVAEGKRTALGVNVVTHYIHDLHHLGQLILLRRMLGAWPPPGGGDTW